MRPKRRLLWGLLLLQMALSGCAERYLGTDPELTSPTAIYEAFWQMYAHNYSGFGARHVDWDSLYTIYRPQVTDQLSERQLLAIIEKTIQPLHDNHVLVGSNRVGFVHSYTITKNVDFPGLTTIQQTYAPSLQALSYGINHTMIKPQIGYIHIGTFANDPSFARVDQVLASMQTCKAIIIDVRDNNGGNDENGLVVAGRFTPNRVVFGYEQWRNGKGYTDFTAQEALYLASRGDWQFTKPVYLLTNRAVFSAGNSFVMMMRALPNVVQIGQPTGDGVAGPVVRELANGWLCGIPSKLESLPNKQPIEGVGIAPNIVISNQGLSNRDLILEAALSLTDKL